MKVVVNDDFGGFSLSEEYALSRGLRSGYDYIDRADAQLVADVEAGKDVSGRYASLAVVVIPDNATDYEITEYDGFESIIAVIDGKIIHISADD